MFRRSKLIAMLAAIGVGVGAGLGGAMAAAGSPSGTSNATTAYVTPGAGSPSTELVVNTNGFCPSSDTYFDVALSGAGASNSADNIIGKSPIPQKGKTGYAAQATETMAEWAQAQSPAATLEGAYTFNFNCFLNGLSSTPDHVFAAVITFKATGSATSNAYTNTVTTLAVTPSSSGSFGSAVTLTATVNSPQAVGQVQFMDGKSKIGAPVKTSGAKAVLRTSTLAVGTHTLTAVFGPLTSDTTNTWGPSTSAAVRYAVTTPAPLFVPVVVGTAKVGSTVDCVEGVLYASTTSWSWYSNGARIGGATQAQYKIPKSLVNKSLSCELSATNHAGTTSGTSAAVKVHKA